MKYLLYKALKNSCFKAERRTRCHHLNPSLNPKKRGKSKTATKAKYKRNKRFRRKIKLFRMLKGS
jgi:hypothetical protein